MASPLEWPNWNESCTGSDMQIRADCAQLYTLQMPRQLDGSLHLRGC